MAKQNRIGRIALVAVVCLLFGAPSFAASVNIGDRLVFSDAFPSASPGRNGWVGGAFLITDTTTGFAWNSFCLEMTEYINFGSTFYVSDVGPSAIEGGRGNSGTLGSLSKIGNSDPISTQTKYLYYLYATNPSQLGVVGPGSALQQKALQNVFWYLENEIGSLPGDTLTQSYFNKAFETPSGDYSNVFVVNPNYRTGGPAQSQLVYLPVSVPEAGALLLFGTGLVGLIGYRRVRRMQ